MAKRITAPLGGGEPQQVTTHSSATATETAGAVAMIVPSGATPQDIAKALETILAALRRDPHVFKG